MLRNRAVAFLLSCLASPLALALGLGPLEATSALNEPFKGRIEVLGAKPEDFDTLTVGLAGDEAFARAGIERAGALFQLRFQVSDATDGKDYIAVTSRDPIREPFLNFLLEMNWANGRMLREYTVLLDPPTYDPNRRLAATPAPAAPAAARPAVAPRAATPAYTPRPAAAPSPAPSTGAGAGAGQDIEVAPGDTLWSIARSARPDPGVSVQQMMLALLRANPEAFVNDNVNQLRRGAVLRVPDAASIAGISNAEAIAEIRRQHQVWSEYRGHVAAAPAAQPMGAPAESGAEPSTPAAASDADARLELVAPGDKPAETEPTKPGAAADEGAAAGGNAKLLADEQSDTSARQAGDLNERLAEAEEIINILQRQVNIKDQELAALQARLAELGVKPADIPQPQTETGAEPATVPATEGAATPEPATTEPATAEAAPETPATAEAEPEIDVDAPTPPAAEPATPAPPAATAEEPEVEVEAPAAGFPANLVPKDIADLVPGGALGVIALVVLILLALIGSIARAVFKTRAAPSEPVATPVSTTPVAPAPSDDTTTLLGGAAAATAGADTVDEFSKTLTSFDPMATSPSLPAFDPQATVEASAAEATVQQAAVPESDPLEEVNVYLAYERFDQAEELVKRVIAQNPDRHEFKLRLLEVYYSSNDRAAYEAAARELYDAVGESDPLWASAVAMWSEMSPDRALFEEGGNLEITAAPAAAKAFVDITGDSDVDLTEATITHAPGGHEAGLDFDLGAVPDQAGGDDVIDLTGGDALGADDDVLDLTRAGDADDLGAVLDLTEQAPAEAQFDIAASGIFDLTEGEGGGNELLDVTGGDLDTGLPAPLDLAAGGDMLDITGGDADGGDLLDITGGGHGSDDLLDITGGGHGGDDLLDISGGGQVGDDLLDLGLGDLEPLSRTTGGSDLLDVTKTGDVSTVDDNDLLNVTSSGPQAPALDEDELDLDLGGLDAELAPPATVEDEDALAFDISDTVAPALGAPRDHVPAGGVADEMLDLTGGGLGAADEDALEFDIGGLDIEDHPTVEMEVPKAQAPGLDLDLGLGDDEPGELDFDIGAASDDDLSGAFDISESEDAAGGLEITMGSTQPFDGELSLKGDALDALALDEDAVGEPPALDFGLTTEMGSLAMVDENLAGEETVDMSSMGLARNSLLLDAENDGLDDLTIDLEGALDGGIETVEMNGAHIDTMALDALDIESDDHPDLGASQTIVMPVDHTVERQSAADEADTKLNLAKAYIELGDAEGARSILDEVVVEGTPAQQAEARGLLGQLKR